jgi:hypothetical protein
MIMDLTDKPKIRLFYELDEDTNILTITFKDDLDVELGTIEIENSKYRSFMKALALMSEERVTTLMEQVGYKVTYDIQSLIGEVSFG